jgi:hypothetical protein
VKGRQEGGEARGGCRKRRVEREARKEQVREVEKGEGDQGDMAGGIRWARGEGE